MATLLSQGKLRGASTGIRGQHTGRGPRPQPAPALGPAVQIPVAPSALGHPMGTLCCPSGAQHPWGLTHQQGVVGATSTESVLVSQVHGPGHQPL